MIAPCTPLRLLASLALGGALLACDGGPSTVSVGEGRDRFLPDGGGDAAADGAVLDGGGDADMDAASGEAPFVPPEGATMDAAALGLDASLALPDGAWIFEDGAIRLADGAIIDRDTLIDLLSDPDMSNCEIAEEDQWQTRVPLQDEGGYDLVPGPIGFGLAYQALTDGDCARAVNVVQPPSSGSFPAPRSLLDDCRIVRDVSLLRRDSGWLVAWVDNHSGMAELHTLELDDAMQATGSRTRITDNEGVYEFRPTMSRINGRDVLAWISRDTATDEHWITARFLDGEQEQFEILGRSASQKPHALALSPIGVDVGGIAWVGTIENPGVWLQPLGNDARPAGSRVKLTERVSSSSSVSLGRRIDGGGIAYSVVIDGYPQVRFRRLDNSAQPIADERTILGAPNLSQDASIYALGGGYALTYRALPRGAQVEPEIRLMFVTREGNVMRDAAGRLVSFPVSPATQGNGRTDVVVSIEGQIMVAWVDADPHTSDNLLKVVRRRLDCR